MLSIALVIAASVAQQMAPASQGKLQCLSPIESSKTCDSLSKISQVAPGRYRYEAELLYDADGPVLVTERGVVTIQGAKICETIRLPQIDTYTFKVGGVPATTAQTARYRAHFKKTFAPLAGQSLCSTITPEEDGLHAIESYVGGRRVPGLDYSMKWVSPNDGWKVGP